MNKICFIGEKSDLLLWYPTGADVFPVENNEQTKTKLIETVAQGYCIIFVTETVATKLIPLINQLTAEQDVCISIIPSGITSTDQLNQERLKSLAIKAVGADIVSAKT